MAEMTAFQVLITNLPRPEKEEDESDNIRESAFPETVLKLYLEQYKQEHVFSLLKGKVGLAQIFVSKPERANAMMFVLGLAALIRNIIDGRFSRQWGYSRLRRI